jgi:hypothetical protein
MATRASEKAPVAKTAVAVETPVKSCAIVGFAPTWQQTPWDDRNLELWGMNALHRVAGERNWSRWYQLHDIELGHGKNDYDHLGWLRAQKDIPIFMWEEHIAKYEIPNAVPYPKQEILDFFDTDYFTNTVSWMLAHAIYEGYKNIQVYGVDMAQDSVLQGQSEYSYQRPSCEFFMGWARGAGIDLYLPPESDLLKTPYLYGAERGDHFRVKMEARLKELNKRRGQLQNDVNQKNMVIQQLNGAIEDTTYYLRAWSVQYGNAPAPSPNGNGQVVDLSAPEQMEAQSAS